MRFLTKLKPNYWSSQATALLLASKIAKIKKSSKKPRIKIAIEGRAAAGKTILSNSIAWWLSKAFGIKSVKLSSDLVLEAREKRDPSNEVSWFRYQKLREMIDTATSAMPGTKLAFSGIYSSGKTEGTHTINMPTRDSFVVLVEGNYVLHSEVGQDFDYSIYLHLNEPLSMLRQLARRQRGRSLKSLWDLNMQQHFPSYRKFLGPSNKTAHSADTIIDGLMFTPLPKWLLK